MIFGNGNNQKKSPWDDDSSNQDKPGNSPVFDELIKKSQSSFNDAYHKIKKESHQPGGRFKIFYLIAAALFILWLSTGFYIVDEGEQALVIRFGKYDRTASTGLNYHLPEPIEHIIIEKVETLRKEEIGFRSVPGAREYSVEGTPSTRNVMQESLILTGDENIVDINFIVQWKIANLKDYVFNILNTRETVRSVSESAMREVIGNTPLDNAIAEGRSSIEQEAKTLLQKILDSYNSGVEITTLKLLRADPPVEVIDAFRDVQTAKTDKEREINRAWAFHNEIIPKARGEAAQIISESEAYKKEVVEIAKGNAARFNLVYNEYKISKDITKKRIYLETMENILQGMDKIILDSSKSNGVVPYLPLNKLERGQ